MGLEEAWTKKGFLVHCCTGYFPSRLLYVQLDGIELKLSRGIIGYVYSSIWFIREGA